MWQSKERAEGGWRGSDLEKESTAKAKREKGERRQPDKQREKGRKEDGRKKDERENAERRHISLLLLLRLLGQSAP